MLLGFKSKVRQAASVNYQHIEKEERYAIAAMRGQYIKVSEIAKRLGRHRSTVYRELKRNASMHDGNYRASQRADDFIESIGICTHWTYPDTPYGYAYDSVKSRLLESGIRHVRDGLSDRLIDLGKAGINRVPDRSLSGNQGRSGHRGNHARRTIARQDLRLR